MSDIELVIKISERAYNALIHTGFDANLVVDEMRKSIVHGTPLSKGHGRLIDADALPLNAIDDANYGSNYIRIAPTIIEADKEIINETDN